MMIQVILVEDHALVREGIEAMLNKENDIICMACYSTGESLRNGLKKIIPDVILMDIHLPDSMGTELCEEIRSHYPGIRIIALSINNHPALIREMMEKGANGYLLKDADRHEIITGIRTVNSGKIFYSRSATIALRRNQKASIPPLTRRERQVLMLITEGFTNKQIASKLYVDVTTIDSHRKNMLAKYGVSNTPALIKLAMSEHLLD